MFWKMIKPRKVVSYAVVSDINTNGLCFNVNDHIAHGWEPHGPVVATFPEDKPVEYLQAMVRYEEDA